MKQFVDKKKKTNWLAIVMMMVCVQMFNNYFLYYCLICIIFLCLNCFSYTYQLLFVGYKYWTRLITVLVQFKVPLDAIWWCCYSTTLQLRFDYEFVTLPLCLRYASVMLWLCLCYASVMLLLCCYCCFNVLLLCFYWNEILTESVF